MEVYQPYSVEQVADDYGRLDWRNNTPKEDARLQALSELVPDDVETILDVGCGDGQFLMRLASGLDIMGCDVSQGALALCPFPTVRAALPHLPMATQSFDLVTCIEVLEHLPDRLQQPSCEELQRVSAKYVLIAVPHDETLLATTAKCGNCGLKYHKWGHLQHFDRRRLEALFLGWQCVWCREVGPLQPRMPGWLARVRQAFGTWQQGGSASCPSCGDRQQVPSSEFFASRVVRTFAGWYTKFLARRSRPWIVALYLRPDDQQK